MKKGFTLIEILLVVFMVGLLAGLSLPAYRVMFVRNELDVAANAYVQSIRRAQVLSRAQVNDDIWGVFIQPGNITLFFGSNYATRDPAYDEIFEFPNSISVAGLQELTFSGLYSYPSITGSTTLTGTDGATRVVSINNAGVPNF